MKTITYRGPDDLAILDRPEPVVTPGHALVEVAALGICGSDLLLWDGGFDRVVPPVVVGHEFSGVVASANGGPVAEGTRVVVEPLLNCGECAPCRRGDYNVCTRLRLLGIDVDGGGARSVAVPFGRLHPIPDTLDLTLAALAEPTAVALHMWERSGAQPSDTVFIAGGGPIGALVASVARAKGVQKIVISEPNESRRALLDELGFETFDPMKSELSEIIDQLAKDGFDICFELTGVAAGLRSAIQAVRVQGTVLLGGIAHADLPFPSATVVLKEIVLWGARTYRSQNVVEAIELLDAGAVDRRIVTRIVPLEHAITDAFEALRSARDEMKILIDVAQSASVA
jgi:(R,R)-butanediol dehydrogenase/meso-butanediol dehydrogenase/diacetyl reductase